VNVNNLTPSLCETYETIEIIETNGETNGTSIRLNNPNNTNNLNEPCPRLMETNGRKAARQRGGFALFILPGSRGERWISSPLLYPSISLKIKRIHHAHRRDIAECLGVIGNDKRYFI
jgi:hypothetical protein